MAAAAAATGDAGVEKFNPGAIKTLPPVCSTFLLLVGWLIVDKRLLPAWFEIIVGMCIGAAGRGAIATCSFSATGTGEELDPVDVVEVAEAVVVRSGLETRALMICAVTFLLLFLTIGWGVTLVLLFDGTKPINGGDWN